MYKVVETELLKKEIGIQDVKEKNITNPETGGIQG